MKQRVRNFKCGECQTGVVKLSIKENRDNSATITTKACDNKKCKKWYGLKGIDALEEIVEVPTYSPTRD